MPRNSDWRRRCEAAFEQVVSEEAVQLLGWRDVPVDSEAIGVQARRTEPSIRQVFIGRGALTEAQFERKLYVIRKRAEKAIRESALEGKDYFYISSLSSNTIVYKGLLLPYQVGAYYHDLKESDLASALALVHSRFSTNTFPTWPLAHPYRYICHNGEINTLKGNVNWMRARQGRLGSDLFGDDLQKLYPIVYDRQSDSACLDNALEFLVMGGRSLPHAMMMLIPEPWLIPRAFSNTRVKGRLAVRSSCVCSTGRKCTNPIQRTSWPCRGLAVWIVACRFVKAPMDAPLSI